MPDWICPASFPPVTAVDFFENGKIIAGPDRGILIV